MQTKCNLPLVIALMRLTFITGKGETMKKTINQANWTGETVDITINKSKKTVKVNGYTFALKRVCEGVYRVFGSDWGEDILANVYKFEGAYMAISGDYTREDKCMYTAVAQLMCNII